MFLQIKNIGMYSTYNGEKSESFFKVFVAERFIQTSKNKIFKHMTAVSKKIYFDVLDGIVKMKPIDVTSGSYTVYNEDPNEKVPKI